MFLSLYRFRVLVFIREEGDEIEIRCCEYTFLKNFSQVSGNKRRKSNERLNALVEE